MPRHFLGRIAQILPHPVRQSHELLNHCRVLGRNIMLFTYIILQIKERLADFGLLIFDRHPACAARSSGKCAI